VYWVITTRLVVLEVLLIFGHHALTGTGC
jgi:hypothetical protein